MVQILEPENHYFLNNIRWILFEKYSHKKQSYSGVEFEKGSMRITIFNDIIRP